MQLLQLLALDEQLGLASWILPGIHLFMIALLLKLSTLK